VTFEDFRRWALESSRSSSLRWEEPGDAEDPVLLAADDYSALHVIPVPPIYLRHERGHVHWLAGALPDIVANRSLQQVAFHGQAWVSRNPTYRDRPADDPERSELLILHIAEKGRFEVWHAEIRRPRSGLGGVGEWRLSATEKDGAIGDVPERIAVALDNRAGTRGPTMPAAEMVLGPWDVPYDYFPLANMCGPLDYARDNTSSSYFALFRPEEPHVVIVSQALALPEGDDCGGIIDGALQRLHETGHKEFSGPGLSDRTHFVEGEADGQRMYRYTALWRHANAFLEVAVAGPPGRFTKAHLYRYAAIQDERARAALGYQSSMAS
jgi:hypothetical protein